jgi:hypothetical protein
MKDEVAVITTENLTEERAQELDGVTLKFYEAVSALKEKGASVVVRVQHNENNVSPQVFFDRQNLQVVLDYPDANDPNVMDSGSTFRVAFSLDTLCSILPDLQDAATRLTVHIITQQTAAINKLLEAHKDGQTNKPPEKP